MWAPYYPLLHGIVILGVIYTAGVLWLGAIVAVPVNCLKPQII